MHITTSNNEVKCSELQSRFKRSVDEVSQQPTDRSAFQLAKQANRNHETLTINQRATLNSNHNMLALVIHAVSTGASLLATVFFMIGSIAYAGQSKVIENTAWMTVDQQGVQVFLGLRKLYAKANGQSLAIELDDSQCASSICETCSRDGKGAFGLMVGATVFALITLCLCGSLISEGNRESKGLCGGSVFMSLLSMVCGAVALGLFMGDCYKAIDDNADGVDVEWGPGSVLTIIGVILLGLVCIAEVAVSCLPAPAAENSHKAPAQAKPASPEAEKATAVDNTL